MRIVPPSLNPVIQRSRQCFSAFAVALNLFLTNSAIAVTDESVNRSHSDRITTSTFPGETRFDSVFKSIPPAAAIENQDFIAAVICEDEAIYFFKNGSIIGYLSNRVEKKHDSGRVWTAHNGYICRQWSNWDGHRVRCGPLKAIQTRVFPVYGTIRGEHCWQLSVMRNSIYLDKKASNTNANWFISVIVDKLLFNIANSQFSDTIHIPGYVYYTGPTAQIKNDIDFEGTPSSIQLSWEQFSGYIASFLVLLTFCMREMFWLRAVALTSNIAFMTYGYLATLPPVFLLHIILMPINTLRLIQLLKDPYHKTPKPRICNTILK